MSNNILLCSNCFKDHGLSLQAASIGEIMEGICPNCKSSTGNKFDRDAAEEIAYSFFVAGTKHKTDYGEAPVIQFNTLRENSVYANEDLTHDMDLISEKIGIGFFLYEPRLWMIGRIEPLLELKSKKTRRKIIQQLFEKYPKKILTNADIIYRTRINPKRPNDPAEYDSPPIVKKRGRFNTRSFPALYASQDLETCIHECRMTIEDIIYFASLVPNRELMLLDLSISLEEDCTEFESLDLAVHMLFLAGKHSYPITQDLALDAKEYGFDGIIYPSYFTCLRTGSEPVATVSGLSVRRFPQMKDILNKNVIRNIAFFGHPIKEDKLFIKGINRLILTHAKYQYNIGPQDVYRQGWCAY